MQTLLPVRDITQACFRRWSVATLRATSRVRGELSHGCGFVESDNRIVPCCTIHNAQGNVHVVEDREMNTRHVFLDIAITIPITFVVAVVVTYLYSLIAHGAGAIEWGTAFQLALIFGIVLPMTRSRPPRDNP